MPNEHEEHEGHLQPPLAGPPIGYGSHYPGVYNPWHYHHVGTGNWLVPLLAMSPLLAAGNQTVYYPYPVPAAPYSPGYSTYPGYPGTYGYPGAGTGPYGYTGGYPYGAGAGVPGNVPLVPGATGGVPY